MTLYLFVFPLIIILSLDEFNKKFDWGRILGFFILTLFIGFRYDVGVDYFSYKDSFQNIKSSQWLEPGYYYLNLIIEKTNLDFYWVTLIVALITLVFLFKGLHHYREWFAFSLFLFLVSPSGYGFIVNGMRQGIAVAIFFYSSKFIIEKKFLKFLLLILFASLFHKSALILLLIYPIAHIRLRYWIYPVTLIISIVLSNFNIFYNLFVSILSFSPYAKYLLVASMINNVDTNSGLGFLFTNLVGLFILLNSKKIISENSKIRVLYNLYFLFLILRNILFEIKILYRIVVYFEWFSYLIIPLVIFKIFPKKDKYLVSIILIVCYTLIFLKALSNPSYKLLYHMI